MTLPVCGPVTECHWVQLSTNLAGVFSVHVVEAACGCASVVVLCLCQCAVLGERLSCVFVCERACDHMGHVFWEDLFGV